MTMDVQAHIDAAQQAARALDEHLRALVELRDRTTAEIAKHLRASGADLDLDAIAQTITRPYTLVPSSRKDEWYLVQWRGVKMPMHIGWLEKQEAAFNLFRVTRSMDLLTPFPEWLKSEMGIEPPAHAAVIDGTRTQLRLTAGDESAFKKRYGAHLGKRNADGTYQIKAGNAWIRLVAQLIKDGILPYQPQPMDPRDWDEDAVCHITLREYQQQLVEQFIRTGAMLLNIPPGAGKTFITTYLLGHVRGTHLVCVDTTTAKEQWTQFLKENAPNANVVVTTYQGAGKYAQQEFALFVPDEAHRLPAATFSKLAFIKAKYRVGPTGTPWREDDRQYLITALTGFPAHLSWSEMIRSGVLRKPRVIVETHRDDTAKTNRVKELSAHLRGRALIFCDWIEQGNQLANALQVPFVHGETRNKLEQIRNAPVCVVSRIADTSLDLPDLSLVIDFGFMKNARTQGAQRLGRLLHSEKGGSYHLLLTVAEATTEPRRLWGIEQEMLGEVDIEHLDFTGATHRDIREATKSRAIRAPRRSAVHVSTPKSAAPKSEMDVVLADRAVANALQNAYGDATARVRKARMIHAVLKLGWGEAFTLNALLLSGRVKKDWLSVYKSACEIAVQHKLMARVGDGYQTNRAFLNELVKVGQRFSGR